MNDFSEIEDQLRKLRPLPPSNDLAARIETALLEQENWRPSGSNLRSPRFFEQWWRHLTSQPRYNFAFGLGLAAAAILLVFLHFDNRRSNGRAAAVASASPAPAVAAVPAESAQFVPAGLTRVVYHTQDEGLHYRSGYSQPVRRLRLHARDTLQWRNPKTGASLRVSYPSEEVSLVPVSGQ